jgi:hypothetical protein
MSSGEAEGQGYRGKARGLFPRNAIAGANENRLARSEKQSPSQKSSVLTAWNPNWAPTPIFFDSQYFAVEPELPRLETEDRHNCRKH